MLIDMRINFIGLKLTNVKLLNKFSNHKKYERITISVDF